MSRRRSKGKAKRFGEGRHRKARVQRFNAKHPTSRVGGKRQKRP